MFQNTVAVPANRKEGRRPINFGARVSELLQPLPPLRMTVLRIVRYVNKVINNIEFKLLRHKLISYPYEVAVDPTNICNLRCPLCSTGAGTNNHQKGFLDLKTFKKIIDELGPYLYQLHLYNWGEPLLNKDLPEIISYTKKNYPAKVFVSSNLNLLTREYAQKLLDSQLDELTVAADGLSEETYQKYRRGGKLENVLNNIKMLENMKREQGLKKPKIIFRFMVMKHNEHEVEAARKFAKEIGVSFRTKSVRIDMATFGTGSVFNKIDANTEWLATQQKYNRYKKHQERLANGRVCKDPWRRTFISWDGAVTPCCNVFRVEHFFAKDFDSDFKKIWNGPKYIASRKIFSNKYNIQKDGDVICKPCVDSGNNIWVS